MKKYIVEGNDVNGWTVKERLGWFKWAVWFRKFEKLDDAKAAIKAHAGPKTETYSFYEDGSEDLSRYCW